jgi:hypothetical protein
MEKTGARNSANMAINSEVHQPQIPSYFLQDTSASPTIDVQLSPDPPKSSLPTAIEALHLPPNQFNTCVAVREDVDDCCLDGRGGHKQSTLSPPPESSLPTAIEVLHSPPKPLNIRTTMREGVEDCYLEGRGGHKQSTSPSIDALSFPPLDSSVYATTDAPHLQFKQPNISAVASDNASSACDDVFELMQLL